MRTAYAVIHLLLFVAAGCAGSRTSKEVRKVETEVRTHEGDTSAGARDIDQAEDDMEPESDPDDR